MGSLESFEALPAASVTTAGSIYFTKDGDKAYGKLYYDDANGVRVKITPEITKIDCGIDSSDNFRFWLTKEDGTKLESDIVPVAGFTDSTIPYPYNGLLGHGNQAVLGTKTFQSLIIGSLASAVSYEKQSLFLTDTMLGVKDSTNIPVILGDGHTFIGSSLIGDIALTSTDQITEWDTMFDDLDEMFGTTTEGYSLTLAGDRGIILADYNSMYLFKDGVFWSPALGHLEMPIEQAHIETIYTTTINATAVNGLFTGNLNGNAATTSKFATPVSINDTPFDGSAPITTVKWGEARNFSISNQAGTTGIDVDGNSPVVLVIPSEMTNFTSITSTTMLGTHLGDAGNLAWQNIHGQNLYLYNTQSLAYGHLLNSGSSNGIKTLYLPDSEGELVYHVKSDAVGDEESPVYVTSAGEIVDCTTIAVNHGGTGRNTLTAGAVLVGNGTNALTQIAGTTAGRILTSDGSNAAPLYAAPTLDWTSGAAAGPILNFKLNNATYSATVIPSAASDASGVVTTGIQTFAGDKTFAGATSMNSTLSVSGTSAFTGQMTVNNVVLKSQLKSQSNGSSYLTLTDAVATLTSTKIYLNGTSIVLNSSNYGTSLPTSGSEGQIFFLLV